LEFGSSFSILFRIKVRRLRMLSGERPDSNA